MKKATLLGLLVLLSTAFGLTANSQTVARQQSEVSDRDLVNALRHGGLREAARLKGHYVQRIDPSWDWFAFSLEGLTSSSIAVVIGQATEIGCQLSEEGEVLNTNYNVVIKESLIGNFRSGNTIQVAMQGGKLEFEDGTSVEVQTPGFERMVTGKTYLLFLHANGNGSPVLITTGGPSGVLEITGEQIRAFGRSTDTLTKELSNRTLNDIIHEVQSKSPGN